MDRTRTTTTDTALAVLAVLAATAAIYLLKPILMPLTVALVLACLLAPATTGLRRILPGVGPTMAAVLLFLLLSFVGLYLATLTAESLVQAAKTLPSDVDHLAGKVSHRLTDLVRDRPYLEWLMLDPRTIDTLGEINRVRLFNTLSYYLADLTGWVGEGILILFLVLFLLAESEMLTPKVIRFLAPSPAGAAAAERTLRSITRQVRAYLIARTLINLGLALVLGLAFWLLGLSFPLALGLFVGAVNYIPYIGPVIGGIPPALVQLGQTESFGDVLILVAIYVAIINVEGYMITPIVMGRSLDLNGTTVLIACMVWGFLWGLIGLFLAMPLAVGMKLIFQHSPGLYRWADLMSRDWQPPLAVAAEDPPLPPQPDAPAPPPPLEEPAASPRPSRTPTPAR